MIHHIGLIVPEKDLAGVKGIPVSASKGWIISNQKFTPKYYDDIRPNETQSVSKGQCQYLLNIYNL